VIGKIGTDVEDAKCCWLVCTALKEASEEQKIVIKVRAEVCRTWCVIARVAVAAADSAGGHEAPS
jgi:hypothetical protein